MTTPMMFRNHFQVAYVTRNIDACTAALGERFGLTKWQIMPMHPKAPVTRLGFAYAGEMLIELIEAVPGRNTIFRDWIPESEDGARLHHLGYMIDTEEAWAAAVGQYQAAGITLFSDSMGDLLDFGYADTVAQLGHYCEIVRLKPAGKDFFADAPRN